MLFSSLVFQRDVKILQKIYQYVHHFIVNVFLIFIEQHVINKVMVTYFNPVTPTKQLSKKKK